MTDDQPYLEGFAPAPRTAVEARRAARKLFFALRPDEAIAARVTALSSRLKRDNCLAGKPLKSENLHVTVFPFWQGDAVTADLVEDASRCAQAIQASAFDVVFDMAMSFRRKEDYCLVLGDTRGAAGIYNLQRKFVMCFPHIRAGSLTPHMTLLYADKFVDKQPVEPVRWMARDFVLIQSFVGQGRHQVMARWPLR